MEGPVASDQQLLLTIDKVVVDQVNTVWALLFCVIFVLFFSHPTALCSSLP
jgi:hypothetical protein